MAVSKHKPLLNLKKLTRPLISKLRYGIVALILSVFIFFDVYNLVMLFSANQLHHVYLVPSIEKLLLSMFGAELSLWSDMDVKAVFNLDDHEVSHQGHIQLFGFALCLLPVLAAVVQACLVALDYYTANILKVHHASAVLRSSHNIFTMVYSIVILILLLDIALFFIKGWYQDRVRKNKVKK